MSKLYESMENFLTEIEEDSKRLEEEKNIEKSKENNSDEEFEEVSDNLVDNLYKSRDKIMSLNEDLETERLKVSWRLGWETIATYKDTDRSKNQKKKNKFNQKLVKDGDTGIEASVEKRKAVCSSMSMKTVRNSKKKEVAMTKHAGQDTERNVNMTEKESVSEWPMRVYSYETKAQKEWNRRYTTKPRQWVSQLWLL